MAQCRFCKSDIPGDATRCPHCTSFLDGEQPQVSQGQVIYILDKGLVNFAKFAGLFLAIFAGVGLSIYGFDIKKIHDEIEKESKEIKETLLGGQQLKLDISLAELDARKATTDIKKDVEMAESSAREASETSSKIQSYLQEALESRRQIEVVKVGVVAQFQGGKTPLTPQVSQAALGPTQLQPPVDARVLETLKNVLTPEQFSALKPKIVTKESVGLHRQIFDAKGTADLPGDLVRSEGDAPTSDPAATEVYENLEIVHRFFKEVFGWAIPDNKGKTLVATIHYLQEYDNGFWNGVQLVLGDGDGVIFRKGGFSSLSILAHEISIAANQWMAQLVFHDQSGALAESFGNIMSCLVEQWQKQQTADDASWLVGAGVFAPGFKGRALVDVAYPGTAYYDPKLGKDPQPGRMKDYVQTEADNGGVHINSGIPNKAFFELSNKLKGYAWEKPGKIWFESYRTLTPNSTFQDLANATLDVAQKTYGERSPEREAVIQSWAAVGITVGETNLETSIRLTQSLAAFRDQLTSGAPSPAAKHGEGLTRNVFNANNSTDLPGFQVRNEGQASVSDPAANEVYDNLGLVYRFFKDAFGRDSVDNKGKRLVATIHYGENYVAAVWNGQQLVFGDGDGLNFKRFTAALDVLAARLTEGVTQFTAQLGHQGQPGALNMSMSYMFGSMVKQWALGQTVDQADWLIGAEVIGPALTGNALVDVANPGTTYDSPLFLRGEKRPQVGHMVDYDHTEKDNGGIHINSGIPNRAFVLAAKAIGGHSWEKTGKIWYVTLTERLTENSDFAKCAAETVSVARELYPKDPSIAEKVAKAWTDVGVLKEGSTARGALSGKP